jgi:hypothetical protein
LPQIAYAAGSITSSYTVAGQFTGGMILGYIISTLNAAVQVSFDGVNDHIAVPAGSTTPVFIPLDFKSNLCCLPNPIIAVKQIGDATTGSLYVTCFTADWP